MQLLTSPREPLTNESLASREGRAMSTECETDIFSLPYRTFISKVPFFFGILLQQATPREIIFYSISSCPSVCVHRPTRKEHTVRVSRRGNQPVALCRRTRISASRSVGGGLDRHATRHSHALCIRALLGETPFPVYSSGVSLSPFHLYRH